MSIASNANQFTRQPVQLTVRRRRTQNATGCSVELPEGIPIAGVSSAKIETDENGAAVLTIKISNFSVDMSDSPAQLYDWPSLNAVPQLGFRRR